MEAAFVLHRWPYQENSLIVEVFSREQGRFRVVARSARRSKGGNGNLLQPFQPLHIEWRGRGELKTLISVESAPLRLSLQGQSLYCGFYLNELIQRLVPEHAALPLLFDDYQRTLTLLTDNIAAEPVLRRFEWQLLQHLQLDFDWLTDIDSGDEIAADTMYYFRAEEGLAQVVHGREPLPHIEGRDLLALAQFNLHDNRLLNLYKRIMRAALAPYLGTKPLRSRELFARQQVDRPAESPAATSSDNKQNSK